MKKIRVYIAMAAVALAAVGCQQDPKVDFGLGAENITIGAVGGVEKVKISADDNWIASTDNTWITISPANGRGSAECKISIDSALLSTPRNGEVIIENMATHEIKKIAVSQEGFPYSIELEDSQVEIANFKAYGQRNFSVTLSTNVDFDVKIDKNWLTNKKYSVELPRGVRPRQVTIDFEWDINSTAFERVAEVQFVPKGGEQMARQDVLKVFQAASEPIEENTRKGDSVALISIQRSLQTLSGWDPSTSMDSWNNVVLWEEGMNGYTPDKKGRVKYVEFLLFNTKEALPYEFRYLTAAEEIYIFGNANTFLKHLELGDAITELTQLKRLTVGSYGLDDLDESLTKLKNLEYLDVGSNNFNVVPKVLTKKNFPKLRTLILNANQRHAIYDLSNDTRQNIGGLSEEKEFPKELLMWNLDTLILSVNYLHGALPSFKDDDNVPFYTEEDRRMSNDTLPEMLVGKVKKVSPNTKRLSINHNRLTGELPDWLLYHPSLDIWIPYSLVFPQEGNDREGNKAGFSNEPVNLDYYYNLYPFKNKPIEGQ
jgi:hypothetical protein